MSNKTKLNPELAYNLRLAARAEKAVRDENFEARAGLCQKFVRQVVQAEYSSKYDAYHRASAEKSRRAWIAAGFAVDPARGSVVGDILYKRGTEANPAGHVGIRVAGNRVAENSSTTRGRVQGAKGFRTLQAFGKVDTIVRLPARK